MARKKIILIISRREPLSENTIKRLGSFKHVLYIYDDGCSEPWRRFGFPLKQHINEEDCGTTLPSDFLEKPATELDEFTVEFHH